MVREVNRETGDHLSRTTTGWRSVRVYRVASVRGKTKEDAVANIREAIRGYIIALEEDKLPVPEERFDAMLMAV